MPSREERRWQHHDAAKKMRKVRRYVKHNREPQRARRKDWMPASLDDLDEFDDLPERERVMPRGERERRQMLVALIEKAEEEVDGVDGVNEVGADEESPSTETEVAGQPGIVVEVSSSLCRVELNGHSLVCGTRGSLSVEETGFTNVVAVGDQVLVSADGGERGIVEAVLPRRNFLARPDVFYGHLKQVIAANVDQLLVVASWRDPHFWPELVDRYLITAERNNLSPIMCVNKVDLAEDVAACRATLQPYLDLGYRVLFTSAVTGEGVGKLRKVLHGKVTVLAGMSGVGKSSLLEAVQPGLQLRTAEVSDRSHEGRHTTTQVNLLRLAAGGFVADTPGLREFGLSGLRREELVRFYPEITAVSGGCRFNDCSHTHEPGCAVKAAAERGLVSAMRYHSYQKIYLDLPA